MNFTSCWKKLLLVVLAFEAVQPEGSRVNSLCTGWVVSSMVPDALLLDLMLMSCKEGKLLLVVIFFQPI